MIAGPGTRVYVSVSARPGRFGATVYGRLFELLGVDAVYLPRPAPARAEQVIGSIRGLGLAGASVSSPHKSAVLPLLDGVDSAARGADAVNTIINENGRLVGSCTDIDGVAGALREVAPESAVIYGAGGVVGPAAAGLRAIGCERIAVVARRAEQAAEAAERFGLEVGAPERFDALINATPASDSPELLGLLGRARALLDMPVSAEDTALAAAARERGLAVATGVDMCSHQVTSQAKLYLGAELAPKIGYELIRRIVVEDYLS